MFRLIKQTILKLVSQATMEMSDQLRILPVKFLYTLDQKRLWI
jgi:hypothetical protein